MSFTENELLISNKSYTNKDFEAVYTELLDLAKKISNKYDPASSNESDPFIVLLKLAAFVTDKVNYNIDKNILEKFMVSATQDKSMRELTEELGYNMHYYIAPETEISVRYPKGTSTTNSIKIPQFDAIVTNNTGDITYVTKEAATLSSNDNWVVLSIPVIQGTIKILNILGSNLITLENIDENNRLYFPETMVAENGVFIQNSNYSYDKWIKVDNLNSQIYGSPCYKFSYDSSKKLPYIEFPTWLPSIINEGLSIRYVVTDGLNGNVKAKALTSISFSTNSDSAFDCKDLVVSNTNASLNGKDPETINEAYQAFKRTIGTFDTLVTCRDYANYIYNNMYDNQGVYPLVSNVQVGDRRNDINYSYNVVTYSSDENTKVISCIPKDSSDNPIISPYDLTIYAFNPVKDYSFSNLKNSTGFKKSFEILSDDSTRNIFTRLENTNSISHNLKEFKENDIYAIKNYYKLTAIISTSYRVTTTEQLEILSNVNEALARDYNCRNINFGYEIPFDELFNTISNADARIKSVALYEPDLTTKIYYRDNSTEKAKEEDINNNNHISDRFMTILCKNILSGKISMFEYDKQFDYNYGEDTSGGGGVYTNITNFTSNCNLDDIVAGGEYKLLNNEVIQFIAPNLITKTTYVYGVNYSLTLNGDAPYIPANTEYKLQSGEKLIIEYKDASDKIIIRPYQAGDIFKCNLNLEDTEKKSLTKTPTLLGAVNSNYPTQYEYTKFFTLSQNQELQHRVINEEKITTSTYFYWHLNNAENKLIFEDEGNNIYSYLLKDNEYLFYSDLNFKYLYSYGSGTKIIVPKSLKDILESTTIEKITDITELVEDGIEAFSKNFTLIDCDSTTNTFTLQEQQIITLTTNDIIKNTSNDKQLEIPNNTFNNLTNDGKISYLFENDATEYTLTNGGGVYSWKVRAILDLYSSNTIAQTLVNKQEITFTYKDKEGAERTLPVTSGKSFKLSSTFEKQGGEKVSLSYVDINLNTVQPNVYVYTQTDTSKLLKSTYDNKYLARFIWDNPKAEQLPIESIISSITLKIPSTDTSNYSLIMVYCDGLDNQATNNKKTITIETSGIKDYLNNKNNPEDLKELKNGMNILYIPSKINDLPVNELKFTAKIDSIDQSSTIEDLKSVEEDFIMILDKIKIINGYNKDFGFTTGTKFGDSNITDLYNYFMSRDDLANAFNQFYCTADIDQSKLIETSNQYNIMSPYIFYDSNNIANKWTLSEIDFENSDIFIAKSSCKEYKS